MAAARLRGIGRSALSSHRDRLIFRPLAISGRTPAAQLGAILIGVVTGAGNVFVGRACELAELERALASARAGSGATVLIAGEAGIGKSRVTAELGRRAREAGFEVLLGHSIDLVGTELPYQPFVEALRPLGDASPSDRNTAGSQLGAFAGTLELLSGRAAETPVLLVLEDLHWADVSTLDLVVFLAHNLDDQAVLLLATYRADENSSGERMWRFAERARRSSSTLILELGPLQRDELTDLIRAQAGSLPIMVVNEIAARSEGNPFFAEELLAAAATDSSEIPRGLRDLLLQRVGTVDQATQEVLRLAAAAGRDVGYPLLRATAELAEVALRDSLRQAVEQGVLVVEPRTGSFRFRHALLAEAIYSTILPGEREELHARLAEELERSGAAGAAELAPHWAAAGRATDALVASIEAASEAETVFGLAEALAHTERALALWETVPAAAELVRVDLVDLHAWAAELASLTGAAPRAVELVRRAIDLVEREDPLRAARLYERLGQYLHESGKTDAALVAFERVVDLVPTLPPSAERARALAGLGHGLMLAWRFDESLAICKQALPLARSTGERAAELRTLLNLGRDLAYLGRADEGVNGLEHQLGLAAESGDPLALLDAYVALTDVLMMLGRPAESARVGKRGLEALHQYGIDSTVLVANTIEALLATGAWDEADSTSRAALRASSANFPYMLLMLRADLELGRGDFEAARAHLDAALGTLREDRGQGVYDVFVAELALWERRWTDADRAVHDGLECARSRQAAQLHIWFCAKGLRAQAELAALARARRDTEAAHAWLAKARKLLAVARRSAQEASAVTPNAAGWLALGRGRVRARPGHRPARIVVGSRCRLGAARAGAPRGLLPLARGRVTRRRRRLPHRGGADRSGRRTPSPLASARSRCCANSTFSPSAPGSTSTHPRVSHPTAGTTCSSRSA